jgi:hypothetical protein
MEIHVNLNPKHGSQHPKEIKPGTPGGLLAVGVFCVLLLGVITAVITSSMKKQSYAHDHFKQVSAQVVESHTERHRKSDRSRNNNATITISNSTNDPNYSYSAVITYRYSIGGQSYTSSRYSYAGSGGSGYQTDAQNMVSQHPAGAQVTAWYNPDKPDEAVIDNSEPSTTVPYAALGLMWCVALLVLGKGVVAVLNTKKM